MFSSVCRVCLASNVRMHCIQTAGYKEIYEKVAGTKLNSGDGRPVTICYICCSQLRRCHQFSEMSQKAEQIFTDLIKNGLEATQMVNLNLRIQHNLTSITLHSMSLNTSIVRAEVKKDPESNEDIFDENALENGTIDNTKEAHLIKEDPESCYNQFNNTSVRSSHNIDMTEELHIQSKTTKQDNLQPTAPTIIEQRLHIPSKTTEQANLEPKTHPNKCHVCDETFTLKIALNAHMKCHSLSEQYRCRKCQKYFYCKIKLEKHKCIKKADADQLTEQFKHDVKKPFYSCNKCTKIFRYKRNLRQHMVSHSELKPFLCEICNKSYKWKHCLKIHKMSHDSVYPFECETCSKRFLLKCALAKHILVHTGQRPYTCYVCKSSFKQVNHLKRHLTSHNANKPFECDRCNTKYTRKEHLVKHLLNVHTPISQ